VALLAARLNSGEQSALWFLVRNNKPKIKMTKIKIMLAATALITVAIQTKAIPINGAVSFSGSVTLDTADPATAKSVTTWANTRVENADGDFALGGLITGTPAAFTAPWTFVPSTPTPLLWSSGPFSFDLTKIDSVTQGAIGPFHFADVSGEGWVFGPVGYDKTYGTWGFTTQTPSAAGRFSFSASANAVPDSGGTVLLLGMALTGVALLRRSPVI
jgi:hypothetical protein